MNTWAGENVCVRVCVRERKLETITENERNLKNIR